MNYGKYSLIVFMDACMHLIWAGAYELLKAAKERVTCMLLKYKFTHGTGRGYLCMYMAIGISNRCTLSKFNMESIVLEFVFR